MEGKDVLKSGRTLSLRHWPLQKVNSKFPPANKAPNNYIDLEVFLIWLLLPSF